MSQNKVAGQNPLFPITTRPMNQLPSALFFLALGTLMFGATAGAKAGPETLFNGRDLAGWVAMHDGDWRIEEGALICKPPTHSPTHPQKRQSRPPTEQHAGHFYHAI